MNPYYYPPHFEQQQPQASYYQPGSEDYALKIRQQPRDALLAQDGKEKSRKPIDPPPIIEVTVRTEADPVRQFLQSPYLFMTCNLIPGDEGYSGTHAIDQKGMCGTMVSSLHKLKDRDKDGGFFVFGDVSVKRLGEHRLLLSLYEIKKEGSAQFLKSIVSDTFTVHPQKEYPGLEESTDLSRSFADQGVRLRLRKEPRTLSGSSGRKRSFPFGAQQSPQAGSSRQPGIARTSGGYITSPLVQAQTSYSGSDFGESESKRHRSGDSLGQYTGYPPPTQTLPSQSSMPSHGGISGGYQSQSPMSMPRLTAQTVPSQMPPSQSRYSTYYQSAPSSTPATQSDFNFRSGSYPRLDPADPQQQQQQQQQQTSPGVPLGGYDRSSGVGYGSSQQAGPGLTPMAGYQSPSANSHAGMNPSAASYSPQGLHYGSMQDPGQYSSYAPPQHQQYRGDSAYGSSTLGQQPFPTTSQQQQQQQQQHQQQQQPQYGDLSQGYPSSYNPQSRGPSYPPPPPGRSWGQQ